jgi:hypothetical protein
LRLVLTDEDISCRQPGGGSSAAVRPASGQSFPFRTDAAHLAASDLASSYINYPNPFAAGREETIFCFNLPRPGRVSLRLLTSRGESVVTLLQEAPLGAGLHQDTSWDGRNGRGHAVQNGVYLAELSVIYSGGGSDRIMRKVAVVR